MLVNFKNVYIKKEYAVVSLWVVKHQLLRDHTPQLPAWRFHDLNHDPLNLTLTPFSQCEATLLHNSCVAQQVGIKDISKLGDFQTNPGQCGSTGVFMQQVWIQRGRSEQVTERREAREA